MHNLPIDNVYVPVKQRPLIWGPDSGLCTCLAMLRIIVQGSYLFGQQNNQMSGTN
jgi:hypothetical protein